MSDSGILPEMSKFTYVNQKGFEKSRIFDPYAYRHHYDEDQLESLLIKYMELYQNVHDEAICFMEEAPNNKFLSKCTDSIEFGIHRVKSLKTLISVTQENIRNFFKIDDEIEEEPIKARLSIFRTKMEDYEPEEDYKSESITRASDREESIIDPTTLEDDILTLSKLHPRASVEFLNQLISGEKLASIPAVYINLAWVNKMLEKIKTEMDILENEEVSNNQYKVVFGSILKLASIYDYYYSSFGAWTNNPFYCKEEIDEIQDHLDFVEVLDEEDYFDQAERGYLEAGRYLAVASKSCKHPSMCRQAFSLSGWLPLYYLFKRKEGASKGLYFMNTLNKERFQRMNQWTQTALMKSIGKITAPKVELEEKIYVKMSLKDELSYKNNLRSSKIPRMCRFDLDLPFEVKMKHYDSEEYLKIRVTSSQDWGTVNWKKGKLNSQTADPIVIPVAIVYIHGGGFIGGSTGSYRNVLRKLAVMTGCPIFSFDYRLAPQYKYPTGISDWWLSYLWIRHYSEKYLGVKFERCILIGDSAGGNISLSLSLVAIQKNCIKPDGLMLWYPNVWSNRNEFFPSSLLSIDEPYLNAMFIDFWCTSYLDDEDRSTEYIWSPIYAPRKLLKEMPPIRFGIPAIDPLRDAGIEMARKWIKSGVDVKGKIYKNLFHGYLEMDGFPFYMKDAENAFNDTVEYLLELIGEEKAIVESA